EAQRNRRIVMDHHEKSGFDILPRWVSQRPKSYAGLARPDYSEVSREILRLPNCCRLATPARTRRRAKRPARPSNAPPPRAPPPPPELGGSVTVKLAVCAVEAPAAFE